MSKMSPQLAQWKARAHFLNYDGDQIAYWTDGLDSGSRPCC